MNITVNYFKVKKKHIFSFEQEIIEEESMEMEQRKF